MDLCSSVSKLTITLFLFVRFLSHSCRILSYQFEIMTAQLNTSREGRHTKTVEVFLDHGGIPFDLKAADGRTCIEMTRNQGTIDLITKRMAEKGESSEL